MKKEKTFLLNNLRLFGVEIPNKRIVIGLRYIHGIGFPTAEKICKACKIDENKRAFNLVETEIEAIRNYITTNKLIIEGDLKTNRKRDIQILIDVRCYRGIRHKAGLPVRGQRTKTNARTRKGKVKSQIANKKKVVK